MDKITPKWIALIFSIIVTLGGGIWGASSAYTNIINGQEALDKKFESHLNGNDATIAMLDSIRMVLQEHLVWDTVYVITQGYLDERQQRQIADMRNEIKELKGR